MTNVSKAAVTSGGIMGPFVLHVAPILRIEILSKLSTWAIEHKLVTI